MLNRVVAESVVAESVVAESGLFFVVAESVVAEFGLVAEAGLLKRCTSVMPCMMVGRINEKLPNDD